MPGVKDWLKKASNDLKASKKLSYDDETLDCSVFHTHQCSEKVLKAFLILAQKSIPKTHDFGLLLVCCMEMNHEFVLLQEESRSLNAYGHNARYPNDSFYVDKQTAQQATKMAEKVFFFIKNKI